MKILYPFAALALTMAGGCTGGKCDTGDTAACDTSTGDTAFYDGETYISSVFWDCDDESYWYDFYTVGWVGDGNLDITETADTTSTTPWSEAHPIGSYEASPYGYWDNLYLELTVLQEPDCDRTNYSASDACWKMQEDGVNTLWTCDASYYDGLTWALTVYEYESPSQEADCATWGHKTSYYSGCTDVADWR